MDRPKVSVIVPIYNAEKYLNECLESIRRQTLKDIEVICVDDGSTDDTPNIIKDFMDRDPRFRVIYKPNTGYGDSMNRGISAAKGEYIGIVESDDLIVKEMYESLYDLSENGTADIVKGNFLDCYDQPDGTVKKIENKERESMPDTEDAFTLREHREILLGHPSIWSAIYRREFLIDNDISFETVKGGGWVDNPFFYETLFCAEKIKWTSKPYYCYRKTNPSSSSTGYDLSIPFERMTEVFSLAEKYEYNDSETLKYIYIRALNYLRGAIGEPHYAGNEDYVRPYIRRMLKMMDPGIISGQFSDQDQMLFWKYRSPIDSIMPGTIINNDDYEDLTAENEFLYRYYGTLENEIDEADAQRDFLQYTIDETRKSKSYRWGLKLTALPRKIRQMLTGNRRQAGNESSL